MCILSRRIYSGMNWACAHLLAYALLLTTAGNAAADDGVPPGASPDLRAAVVRVEAAVDPFSLGPGLAATLAGRPTWTTYEAELARRLRTGATGTGFLINDDGFLVTSAHVLLSGVRYPGLRLTRSAWDSMARLLTVMRDFWVTVGEGDERRSYLAIPVIIAEDLDLAVLQVCRPPEDASRFAFLPISGSDALRVGGSVRALGFPEDEFQVSDGEILSLIRGARVHDGMQLVRRTEEGTGREAVLVSGTTPGPVVRLQHSAVTGHGSSGGPLVNDRGQVVGVAYAILSDGRLVAGGGDGAPSLNLAIVSRVLRRFLAAHAIRYTDAGP
jgi:S1-C subfamily serine protease